METVERKRPRPRRSFTLSSRLRSDDHLDATASVGVELALLWLPWLQ